MNQYVRDMLSCCGDGLDAGMRQLALDDARTLGEMGVSDDRERNLVFYLDAFLDDLCREMGRPAPEDRQAVIRAAFEDLRGKEDVDLLAIRRAVARALGRRKTAYPNIQGVSESNLLPKRDLSKWVETLGRVLEAQRGGEGRMGAIDRLTEGWDPVEKSDFQQWARFYAAGDHEKYAALDKRAGAVPLPDMSAPEPEPQDEPVVRKDRTPEENRRALISRLDAAKRLLRMLAPPIWPAEAWHRLYQSCNDLEHEVVGLRTASTVRDRIIRTANMWERAGFASGAAELRKVAQPPEGGEDVATQIEKALTGREYATQPQPKPEGGDLGLGGEIPPPPPEGEAGMPPPGEEGGGAPPEALEPMPEAPPPPEPGEEKKGKKGKKGKGENPFSDSSVADVIDILEPLARKLKEREQVRELSRADMMMEGLGIVSYFPELGEAMAKLIESDNYVSSRLEKIIGKLRGGEGGKGKGEEEPPAIEMGGPEEQKLEVTSLPPQGEAPPEGGGKPPEGGPPAEAPAPPPGG